MLSNELEACAYLFVLAHGSITMNLGKHKPDLLTVPKLAEVLKVSMVLFYSYMDDEVAELLLRFGASGKEVGKRMKNVLKD